MGRAFTDVGRLARKRSKHNAANLNHSPNAKLNPANMRKAYYGGAKHRTDFALHFKQGEGSQNHALSQPSPIQYVDLMPDPRESGPTPTQGRGVASNAHVSRPRPNMRAPPALPGHHCESRTTRIGGQIGEPDATGAASRALEDGGCEGNGGVSKAPLFSHFC